MGVVLLGYYLTARQQDAAAMRHAKRAQTSLELRDMLLERYSIGLHDASDQSEEARLARSLDGHALRDINRYKKAIQWKGPAYKLQVFSQIAGALFLLCGVVTVVLSMIRVSEPLMFASGWVTVGLFVPTAVALIVRERLGDYTEIEFRPDE
ncbi:hypothetical protein ACIPY5_14990 [Microbacterium sp. NPDC089698]|uniref:hypothetical protein n=1 Tax=Microbacterium sp. NPDC089698 TaxID=3364200 RepID=UPI003813B242